MTTFERHWYEGPRIAADEYADDPVVEPLGLDFQHEYARHLREHPVHRHLGRVTIFRMADILFVNRHPYVLGNGAAGALMGGPGNYLIPLDLDGADHHKFRRLLDPLFSPKSKISRITRLDPVMRKLCNELIDGFIDQGQVEAYSQFCTPLPSRIFIDMLGLPASDIDLFTDFKDGVIRPQGDTLEDRIAHAESAAATMLTYLSDLIDERERADDIRDDLIGGFREVEIEGERLTRSEMLNIVLLLVIAGLDTVVASLSCFLMFLGRNPSYRQQIVEDPGIVPSACEELLRHQSPVQQGVRKATRDIVLPSGEEVKAGEIIQAIWAAANLDEDEFPNAQNVDLRRSPNRHIAFASGFHRCLGSHLARMELRIAMEEWHKRIPAYRVVSDNDIQMINYGVRTMFHLPLVLNG